jgi:hypothetical protein
MSDIKVEDLRRQYRALVSEREQIMPVWRSVADNFIPLKRVLLEDNYEPEEVYIQMGQINDWIVDATPVKSMRVLGSGMQSGMTSPAKKWFKLGHSDSNLERNAQVKEWLEDAERKTFDTMSRSNFYNNTHRCYLEVATFGTLVMLILEDDEKGIRTLCLPAGSYVLASNAKNEIDTLYRRFFMTAEQMVDRFGEDDVSMSVLNAYKSPDGKNKWFSVIHAVLPNKKADSSKDDASSMAYSSVYFEEGSEDYDKNRSLSRGGFREKPFVAARWDVTGDSVYGESPAMDVVFFARGLQAMKSTVYKAEQKNADPAMNVPPGMKNASTSPGVRNYQTNPTEKITSTTDIKPNTQGALLLIQDDRKMVVEGLFNDIFRALMLSTSDRMTATEVLERVSEGLRLLGPVLERLQFEFLDPIIDRIFAILLRSGAFLPPPVELENEPLKVEYISPLAQAQKAVGTDGIAKLIQLTQVIAQTKPEVVDNVDWDELIRVYADLIGVSQKVMSDPEEVEKIRELRAAMEAALMEQERENQEVDNLKKMSETKVTDEENAIQSAAAAEAA